MSLRIKLFKDRGTVPAAAESAVHIDTAAADRKAGDGFIEHHRTMQVHGEVRPAPVDGRRAVEWHGRRSPLEGPERVFERRPKIRAFAKALLTHIRGPDDEPAVLPHQYSPPLTAPPLAQPRGHNTHGTR